MVSLLLLRCRGERLRSADVGFVGHRERLMGGLCDTQRRRQGIEAITRNRTDNPCAGGLAVAHRCCRTSRPRLPQPNGVRIRLRRGRAWAPLFSYVNAAVGVEGRDAAVGTELERASGSGDAPRYRHAPMCGHAPAKTVPARLFGVDHKVWFGKVLENLLRHATQLAGYRPLLRMNAQAFTHDEPSLEKEQCK